MQREGVKKRTKRSGRGNGKKDPKPAAWSSTKLQSQAQESEYRNLLSRIERHKDAAEIKKIAARIERENPE